MVRFSFSVLAFLALSNCVSPPVPDSAAGVVDPGQGVGFGNYSEYQAERAAREAELRGQQARANDPILPPASATQTSEGAGPVSNDTLIANASAGIDRATTPSDTTKTAGVIQPANNPGISDEQDFEAVSARETIESDAERLREQRQQYKVIEPTAVPSGSAGGPNIVQYALATTNNVGQQVYRRNTIFAQAKYQRNCAKYISSDRAQLDFLQNGGPQKDRLGLDPDGDGFACGWDPAPFRKAARG